MANTKQPKDSCSDITGSSGQKSTAVNVSSTPITTTPYDHTSDQNIFRDTSIRYLGYANEIGESFRYQYPKYVVPSYIIAFGYCLADAMSTGHHTYYHRHRHNNCNSGKEENEQLRIRRTIVGTLDTLLWQSLASVMIPGYVIHTIVKGTKYSIPKHVRVPIFISTWLPTIIGLGAIPFIVHPIDHSVDYVLDNTVRSYYRYYL